METPWVVPAQSVVQDIGGQEHGAIHSLAIFPREKGGIDKKEGNIGRGADAGIFDDGVQIVVVEIAGERIGIAQQGGQDNGCSSQAVSGSRLFHLLILTGQGTGFSGLDRAE